MICNLCNGLFAAVIGNSYAFKGTRQECAAYIRDYNAG